MRSTGTCVSGFSGLNSSWLTCISDIFYPMCKYRFPDFCFTFLKLVGRTLSNVCFSEAHPCRQKYLTHGDY
jgi:hypothetical protein